MIPPNAKRSTGLHLGILAALTTLMVLAPPDALGAELPTVDLVPDDRAGWSVTNAFAPFTVIFGGYGYWYGSRHIDVVTTPPGAVLDLFYVRRNFQKRYEQADAPVRITLPSRIEAGARDSVMIRALLDGYKQEEIHVRVRSRTDEISIDLMPLPNTLIAFSYTHLAGRDAMTFLTEEALTFRLQKKKDGFSVVLNETSLSPEAKHTLEGVHSSLVDSLVSQQLGEDLVVRVKLADAGLEGLEPRSRQAHDPVRGVYIYLIDLVPADGGAAAVARARAALAQIRPQHVTGCNEIFDAAMREQLDPAALSRALTPRGAFTDPYLRAALKRLGEVSPGGVIRLADGSKFRAALPIELMAAASQAGEVVGYVALLRRFVEELEAPEHRRSALRGLVAPEMGARDFDVVVDTAERRERECRSG